MKIKFLFSIILILFFAPYFSSAQSQWSLRTSFGTASAGGPVGGYHFSFDFGIPLGKTFEFSPTFNFMSTLPQHNIDNYVDLENDYIISSFDGNQKDIYYRGSIMGSMNFLILFKPLKLFNQSGSSRHEIAIGTGLGLKHYAVSFSNYEKINRQYELMSFGSETNLSVEPYFAKFFYNYSITERVLIGVTASIDSYDWEGVALFGLQLGVKF